jgi:hypothetical protein
MFFRVLDEKETQEFHAWARKNYKPGTPIEGFWHPTIQEECVKMNMEQSVFMMDKQGSYIEY